VNDYTIINARILTLAGAPEPRRREAMRELGVIDPGFVIIHGDRIAEVGPGRPEAPSGQVIDADGAVLMPAFVDCHTHACWAGHRFDEHDRRMAGASYLEILRGGGGIMATVRAVLAASEEQLTEDLLQRLGRMLALGTGTVEVKSGYGLDTASELKMLAAIRAADEHTVMTIVPTFLGAHAIDPDAPDHVERTINETLPAAVTAHPGVTCDAYCEEGAWSLADTRRLFENAADMGCPLRVHTDQFHSLGMTRLAVEMGAVSVDHLEAISPADLEHVVRSTTVAVALPCSGFFVDGRYAPAREIIDAGGALALATNYNPGSGPTPSMPFTIALACRKLHLTPAEAITAATMNAACVLHYEDEVGSIEPGKRADLQLLDSGDERELAYELAGPGPRLVMIGGAVVHERPVAGRLAGPLA
jgi:imidazolonepropionase